MHPFVMFVPVILLFFAIWAVALWVQGYRQYVQQFKKSHHDRAPPLGFWGFVRRELKPRFSSQTGAANIGGIMILGIAMVFLAVGFIFLPITTDACSDLLDYTYSSNTSITADNYTGYVALVGITPLLILVGFLTAAVVTGMLGVKVMKGAGGSKLDPGSLMLLGLTIVFIGIGLIIEPVALDGISSVYSGYEAWDSDFTGYTQILLMSPMLVHIGFIAAAVLSGFFGIKRLSSASY